MQLQVCVHRANYEMQITTVLVRGRSNKARLVGPTRVYAALYRHCVDIGKQEFVHEVLAEQNDGQRQSKQQRDEEEDRVDAVGYLAPLFDHILGIGLFVLAPLQQTSRLLQKQEHTLELLCRQVVKNTRTATSQHPGTSHSNGHHSLLGRLALSFLHCVLVLSNRGDLLIAMTTR